MAESLKSLEKISIHMAILAPLEQTPKDLRAAHIVARTTPYILTWLVHGLNVEEFAGRTLEILRIKQTDKETTVRLENELKDLVKSAVNVSPMLQIIVGSRGSGKTTIMQALKKIHELAGRSVVYISGSEVVSSSTQERDFSEETNLIEQRLHEALNSVVAGKPITVILDDLPELASEKALGREKTLNLLCKLLYEYGYGGDETGTGGGKVMVILTSQSEPENLGSFIDILTQFSERTGGFLETVYEGKDIASLIETWYELKEYNLKQVTASQLARYQLITRRGVFIDLDIVWHSYRYVNEKEIEELFRNLVCAVNYAKSLDELNSLKQIVEDKIDIVVDLFKLGYFYIKHIPTPRGLRPQLRKIIEKAAGAYLRQIYNDLLAMPSVKIAGNHERDIAQKYRERLKEVEAIEGIAGLYNIDIVALLRALAHVFMTWPSSDEDNCRLDLVVNYTLKVTATQQGGRKGTRRIDAVLIREDGKIALALLAVTAKPKKSKGGYSVTIPERIRELLPRLKDHQAYIIAFVYDNVVKSKIRQEFAKHGIKPISIVQIEPTGRFLLNPGPAYGVVTLSEIKKKQTLAALKLMQDPDIVQDSDLYEKAFRLIVKPALHDIKVDPPGCSLIELMKSLAVKFAS